MNGIYVPKLSNMTIRDEGDTVVLILNGKRVCDMPWEAAYQMGKGLIAKARKVEERQKHERVAADNALLLRLGIPLGLTDDKYIIKETKIEAAHNTELRKYIPHVDVGIRSKEVVGTPKLSKQKPKE